MTGGPRDGCPAPSANEPGHDRARRLLGRLYSFRVVLSVTWVAALFSLSSPVTPDTARSALVGIALGAYPAFDGLATLIELRMTASPAGHGLLWGNLIAGLTAAASIVWLTGSPGAEVRIFGLWAIASGGIQLVLGAIRQRRLKGQWLMIISGGGSIAAGITFAGLTRTAAAGLPALAQYSLGGAVWYLLTAGWLFLSARSTSRPRTGGLATSVRGHRRLGPRHRPVV